MNFEPSVLMNRFHLLLKGHFVLPTPYNYQSGVDIEKAKATLLLSLSSLPKKYLELDIYVENHLSAFLFAFLAENQELSNL